MNKMKLFEPAMCCSTGLCGVGVDTELLRITTVLKTLAENDIVVDRFNLSTSPMEFVTNNEVHQLLYKEGITKLPLAVVDGEIVVTGRYPTNEEFTKLLEIPATMLKQKSEPLKLHVVR